jgi:xylose isomerase
LELYDIATTGILEDNTEINALTKMLRRNMRRKRCGDLWTILYSGADAFGGAILKLMDAMWALGILCWAKKEGLIDFFSAHDDDLVPWDTDDPEDYLNPENPIHEKLKALKEKADSVGLWMYMITCNLHSHSIFAAGGFTNRDPRIRLLARKKALRAAWIGNYFGAQVITYWVARDGFESIICDALDAYRWLKEALNFVAGACILSNYSIKSGTIETKNNEPRGVSYVPLAGTGLALINELDTPAFWGQNPEILQHSTMGGQSAYLEIKQLTQLAEHNKLTFLHLGGQIPNQFDDDFPLLVGEGQETMILIFHFLDMIDWDGVVEFDCHPLRSDLAPNLPMEQVEEVFKQFIRYNVEMYVMIEQILVPRMEKTMHLGAALMELEGEGDIYGYEKLLSSSTTRQVIQSIIDIKPPSINEQCVVRQDHLSVERELKLALYGVSEKDLAKALRA